MLLYDAENRIGRYGTKKGKGTAGQKENTRREVNGGETEKELD
jgi:hypothetical protein